MSAESKALVRRYVEEVLNKKNLALVDELFASSFIDHDSSMPEARGPAGVKRLASLWPMPAFPTSTSRWRTWWPRETRWFITTRCAAPIEMTSWASLQLVSKST